jgi:hypothetical protein
MKQNRASQFLLILFFSLRELIMKLTAYVLCYL